VGTETDFEDEGHALKCLFWRGIRRETSVEILRCPNSNPIKKALALQFTFSIDGAIAEVAVMLY
jgi:hypothetical protein